MQREFSRPGRFYVQQQRSVKQQGLLGNKTALISVILTLFLLLMLVPLQAVFAAGTSSLTVHVATADNKPIPAATIRIDNAAGYESNMTAVPDDSGTSFTNLAAGTYSVSVSLPVGYILDSIQVGSAAPQTSVTNASKVSVALGDSQNIKVSFTCHKNTDSVFRSHSSATNEFASLTAADGQLTVDASKELRAGPFDIVLVLDYSGSMARSFDNVELDWTDPITGIKYTDQGDYSNPPNSLDLIAKNNPRSRYTGMESSVKQFLTMLKDTSVGKIAVVFFNSDAQVADFSGSDFTDIQTIDIDTFVNQTMRQDHQVVAQTRTDLAFEKARQLLSSAADPTVPSAERERRVVFFTDGEPGYDGFDSLFAFGTLLDAQSSSYISNPYRIMAETYNQADILKTAYGSTGSANNWLTGLAPFPYANQNITYTGTMTYYGASPRPDALGLPVLPKYTQEGPSYFPNVFTPAYNTAEGNGTLNTAWSQASNWENVNPDYNDHDSGLSNYLFGDASPYATDMADLGSNPYAANIATNKHGNFLRTADGQGAIINTIGIIDGATYGASPDRKTMITEFLTKLASDPSGFFEVSNADELEVAFQSIFHEIAGEYPGVYIKFDLNPDWRVYKSDGTPVGTNEADGMWLKGNELWVGPVTASSEQSYLLDIFLYSPTITDFVGTYTKGDTNPNVVAMLARATIHEKTGTSTFTPMDPGTVWIEQIKIAEH